MFRQKFRRVRGWRPSVAAVAGLMIVAGGVAFALLQVQVKLTGNSIHTDNPALLISQSDSNYQGTATGYDFAHIVPGVQASQTEHFMLKNTGTSALALKVSASSLPSNPYGVDLSKVKIILTPYSTTTFMPGTPQTFTLQSLIDADATGGLSIVYPDKLPIGGKEEFNIQASMDADAVSGSIALLTGVDLAFDGVAAN